MTVFHYAFIIEGCNSSSFKFVFAVVFRNRSPYAVFCSVNSQRCLFYMADSRFFIVFSSVTLVNSISILS